MSETFQRNPVVAGSIHGSAYAGTPAEYRWAVDCRTHRTYQDFQNGPSYRTHYWFAASAAAAESRARKHASASYLNTAIVYHPDPADITGEMMASYYDCHGISGYGPATHYGPGDTR